MLAEWFLQSRHIEIIQINTDGITARVHRDGRAWFDQCYDQWQKLTLLELERVNYSAMFIRDVNNYLAVGVDGKVKRKGAYQWNTDDPNNVSVSRTWSQDWSALVIPRAAEEVLVRGADLEKFIWSHADPFDFMIKVKVPRTSRLVASYDAAGDVPLQNTTRYHIATEGPYLFKVMPPLARKGPDAPERRMAVDKGWRVNVCNVVDRFSWETLDRRYYIEETRKLLGMM